MHKILLVGPAAVKGQNSLGGATLSFGHLVRYCSEKQVDYILINTQSFTGKFHNILNFASACIKFFLNVWRVELVFINVSQNGIRFLCPIIFSIAKPLGKKVVVRPFGGSLKDYYERYPSWQKYLFEKTILQSDILFLQTISLMSYFSPLSKKVIQLKTSRYQPNQAVLRGNQRYQKRFVFLGHLKETKGIDIILEAVKELDSSFVIDLYGLIKEPKYQYLEQKDHPNYKGVLKEKDVLTTLRTYDVLILPTFYEGEGYPGVLIEAYSLGLPVIASRWNSIPEIVKENETGFLIEPKSSLALTKAIRSFNDEKYSIMSKNVLNYFSKEFETNMVLKNAFRDLNKLITDA